MLLKPKMWFVLILLIFLQECKASLYGDSPFVDELHPLDVYELVRDQTEDLCIVQFYNGSDPKSDDFVSNYSIAAKSMVGYAKSAAINANKHLFTSFVYKITKLPTYYFFGYYKHLPDPGLNLNTVDEIHEETARQLIRVFEERSVYRLVQNKQNMEMGSGDLHVRMMKSKDAWLVVYYKRDHPKTPELSDIWNELIKLFHERIQFGSLNNPVYKVLELSDEQYPRIEFYPKGKKKDNTPETYSGKFTTENIATYLDDKIMTAAMKPHRIINAYVLEPCTQKKFCIFVFLPSSPKLVETLMEVTNECRKHGWRSWTWFWNKYQEQPELQRVFDVSDLDGPKGTVVVLNVHAAIYMKKSLDQDLDKDVLASITFDIIEDVGFDHNIKTRELPDIKYIKGVHSRDEL